MTYQWPNSCDILVSTSDGELVRRRFEVSVYVGIGGRPE